MLCAGLYGEPITSVSARARVWYVQGRERVHAQDGCTASDIEDDLVLEQVRILVDSVAVALGSDFIFLKRIVSRCDGGVMAGRGNRTSISSWMPMCAH